MDLVAQKSTWLEDLQPEQSYLILRGGNSLSTELRTDTLHLPIQESVRNILEKTILGLEWALSNSDFEFLIRTNVSTYFPVDLVGKFLVTIDPGEIFFGGYIDICHSRIANVTTRTGYVTGTAIVMTRKSVELLIKSNWRSLIGMPDDLAITLALRNVGIEPRGIQRNNLSFSHVFWPSFQIRLKTPSVPILASIRMHMVHDFFHSQNTIKKISSYLRISLFEFRNLFANEGEIKVFFIHVLVMGKRKMSKLHWNKN